MSNFGVLHLVPVSVSVSRSFHLTKKNKRNEKKGGLATLNRREGVCMLPSHASACVPGTDFDQDKAVT